MSEGPTGAVQFSAREISQVDHGKEASMSSTSLSAHHERSRTIGYSLSGAFYLPPERTIVADHGDGVRLYDTEGRGYIDFLAGSGAVLLGHGNPEIADAIAKQARKGTHFYILNERA